MRNLIFLVLVCLSCSISIKVGDQFDEIVGTYQTPCDKGTPEGSPCLYQREFKQDSTYIRRAYDYRGLRRESVGKWKVNRDTIIIHFNADFTKEFSDISKQLEVEFKDPDSLILPFKILDSSKLSLFKEADNDEPACWETWKRIK
jgi:predicted amidophosphoribosyltransferase